tara:strand:+ start:157 stop:399 length:243 start_codon:yes stop_codon:yes gene_type:complete
MPTKQELIEMNEVLTEQLESHMRQISELKMAVYKTIQEKDSYIIELERLASHYERTVNVLSGRVLDLNSRQEIEKTEVNE